MTPEAAMMKCAHARLGEEEREMLNLVKKHIDHHLSELWEGGPFGMKTAPCSTRVIAAAMREYEKHGWAVQVQPLDREMGITDERGRPIMEAANKILERGDAPAWMITLRPVWKAGKES